MGGPIGGTYFKKICNNFLGKVCQSLCRSIWQHIGLLVAAVALNRRYTSVESVSFYNSEDILMLKMNFDVPKKFGAVVVMGLLVGLLAITAVACGSEMKKRRCSCSSCC
ncbi:MAG: hypothetical protein CM1200mP39_11780 [Dehalococcoidia bacterium]|nr:MAG: hypothetical protein CM1200mP39_11780 [Dehalococcoidia bacterium]